MPSIFCCHEGTVRVCIPVIPHMFDVIAIVPGEFGEFEYIGPVSWEGGTADDARG
jgi:hypothetical protein